jgi:uncharacterized protein (TIGR03437 family)
MKENALKQNLALRLTVILLLALLGLATPGLAQLTAGPSSLSFPTTGGADPFGPQFVFINTPNPTTATMSLTTSATWLLAEVTQAPGSIPGFIRVSVNTTGLPNGTYSGTVTVAAAGFTALVIPVTLTIGTSTTTGYTLSATSLVYNYTQGGTLPGTQTFTITSTSAAAITYSLNVQSTGLWLSATPISGGPGTAFVVSVSVNPLALTAGAHSGSIQVIVPGHATQTVFVTLNVAGGGTGGAVSVAPLQMVFSHVLGSPTAPAPQTLSLSSGTAFNYVISVTSQNNWLGVTPQFGGPVTAQNVSVFVTPGILGIGTYQGTLQVQTQVTGQAAQTTNVQVTLNVTTTGSTGGVTISSTNLVFNFIQGGAAPGNQILTLSSATAFSYSLLVGSTGNWLTASPLSGGPLTVANITVGVNPQSLPVGTHTGSIQVVVPGQTTQTVFVTLNITTGGTAAYSVTPAALNLSAAVGGAPVSGSVTISSATPITFTAAVQGATPWLTVNPAAGGPATVSILTVTANPFGLIAGTYFGNIFISVPNQPSQSVTVTFTVGTGGGGGSFTVQPNALTFNWPIGSADPADQLFTINTTTASSFTATALSQGNWLSVTPSGSTSPTATVAARVRPSGLLQGQYTGTITVTVPNQGSQTVQITLNVTGASQTGVTLNPASLVFNFQPGQSAPPLQTFTITTPSPVGFNIQASVPGGFNWLQVGTVSGVTTGSPATATVTVAVNPVGLPVNLYTGTITITATGLPAANLPVTLNVGNVPTGGLNPGQLSFAFQQGTPPPGAQFVIISTAGGQTATFTATSNVNWLQVNPPSGTAPGYIAVSLTNLSTLAPGTYSGIVNVTLSGSAAPVQLPVSLLVSNAPVVRLNVTSANFNYQLGGVAPPGQGQLVEVSSTGPPQSFLVTTSITSPPGGTWLSVPTTSGTTPSQITININAAGLTVGTYAGVVRLAITGQSVIEIPVTLAVSASPLLNVFPGSLTFVSQPAGTVPAPQQVNVTSTSSGAVTLAASASVSSGTNWLTVSPAAGATPANLQIGVNPAGLPEGVYYGTVLVSSSPAGTAANSPVVVPVVLTVGGGGTGGGPGALVITPGPLNFTQIQGGTPPPAQTLSIASGGVPLNFTAVPSVFGGGTWLTVSPGSGTTPGQVQVSVNAGTLSFGTYNASVIVTAPGATNSPQVVPITLTVAAPPTITANPASLTFNATTTGGQPANQTFELRSSAANVNFTATANVTPGVANWLSVSPASGITPATLTVSANPQNLQPGVYNGSITLNVGLASPIVVSVTLNLQQVNPPVISEVLSSASLLPTALAPGMIIAIRGQNLGPTTLVQMQPTPVGSVVSTTLAGVRVLFDGAPGPMVFARNDIIASVVPYGLTGRASTRVVVEYQGVRSREVELRVTEAAPGIFTLATSGSGQGAIHNADFSVNGPANAVARGSWATMYITGEGQTRPAGVDGLITSTALLRNPAAPVQVRVGGRPAEVIYAGTVPTTIMGWIQVSFFIPQDAPVGSAVTVEVSVAGVLSQAGVTMAIR